MLPCASQVTSVGRPNWYFSGGAGGSVLSNGPGDRLRPPAEHHHDAPFGVELDDHVRPLVDHPDVVLRVDADRVRELQAVQALADLAHEGAVLVELEQPRVAAARVHEHVSLRVGGDADAFAEIQVGRQLEEVGHRRVRDDRNVLRFGLGLGERRPGGQQGDQANADAEGTDIASSIASLVTSSLLASFRRVDEAP